MTALSIASDNWLEFDGWCLANGQIDPLAIPSRRFFTAVWRWLTENIDQENLDKLYAAFDQAVHEAENEARKAKQQKEVETEGQPKIIPLKPFQAPPGWRPPGWSDEAAYANSIAGMKGITKTGGGKIGGAVKK